MRLGAIYVHATATAVVVDCKATEQIVAGTWHEGETMNYLAAASTKV